MHVLTVNEHLLETAKARAIAEREMVVSAEQLFATLEDGPSWTNAHFDARRRYQPRWGVLEQSVTTRRRRSPFSRQVCRPWYQSGVTADIQPWTAHSERPQSSPAFQPVE